MSLTSSKGTTWGPLTSKYDLALRLYHHRNFSRSLDIISSLIEEIQNNKEFDWNGLGGSYILLATLYGMVIGELKTNELTKPSLGVLFPQYVNFPTRAQELQERIQKGWLFQLIFDLQLANNEQCLNTCISVEIKCGVKVEAHLGHILKSRGLNQSKEMMKVYLSKDVFPRQGKDAVREKIMGMLSLEGEDEVQQWMDWVEELKDDLDDGINDDYGYDSDNGLEDHEDNIEELDLPDVADYNPSNLTPIDKNHQKELIRQKPRKKQRLDKKKNKPQNKTSLFSLALKRLANRYGGIIPLICLILTILMIINLRRLGITQKLKRVVDSGKRVIAMAFKVSYI